MVSGSAPASADMLADPYLSQLLSYSLDTFKKEPQALQAQQSLLREELEETAVLHHKGFINAAKCFQEISGKVDDVHQQLHALATDMQDLRSQGESFITQAKSTQVCMLLPGLKLLSNGHDIVSPLHELALPLARG